MEKERLAEHLERYHSGASNAATSRELECAFGIKGKELRDAVNALRREGVPIASNGWMCSIPPRPASRWKGVMALEQLYELGGGQEGAPGRGGQAVSPLL